MHSVTRVYLSKLIKSRPLRSMVAWWPVNMAYRSFRWTAVLYSIKRSWTSGHEWGLPSHGTHGPFLPFRICRYLPWLCLGSRKPESCFNVVWTGFSRRLRVNLKRETVDESKAATRADMDEKLLSRRHSCQTSISSTERPFSKVFTHFSSINEEFQGFTPFLHPIGAYTRFFDPVNYLVICDPCICDVVRAPWFEQIGDEIGWRNRFEPVDFKDCERNC